jgi:predicted transcriptional regulator
MARHPTANVALLSIRPEYAQAIMDGRKAVEFRRTLFRRPVSHVVVYASSPLKQVLGFFEVRGIEEDSPEQLWKRHGTRGCVERRWYDEYFARDDRAVAIVVGRVCKAREPLPLKSLGGPSVAPQSFTYVNSRVLGQIAGKTV